MKKKRLLPMGFSEKAKQVIAFILMCVTIFAMVFLAAAVTSCSSQNATANDISSQEEMIFELKCKVENQQKLIRAYENVLHEVWLDKPNYVEEALAEGDAFIELEELMGDTDVFRFRNATDSIRYKYEWFHEGD